MDSTVLSRFRRGELFQVVHRDTDSDFRVHSSQTMAHNTIAVILMISMFCIVNAHADGHAHSFQHFHGPVTGDAREVTWSDKHGKHQDYVAHPHYEFAYGVEDHHTGDYHGQKEHRDGADVTGEYTVKEPDGNVRTVKYRADDTGFHAHVHNSNDD